MPVSSSTEHWIKPDALTINLNHFGDPDYLQVSVLAGAVVMAFKQDVIGYNAAHNYRTWPLEAANTYLETTSAYNVYARLTRSEVNARALVVYDTVLRDIEGREISYAVEEETGETVEVLGDANPDYFFVFLGQISASVDSGGGSVQREWNSAFNAGRLQTNQQQNDLYGGFERMFRPHYDDPLNPDKITWIEALTHLGVAGGITMFVDGGKVNLPSIYEGLPIDNQTLYWEETTNEDGSVTRILKSKAGEGALTLGGLLNVGEWADQVPVTDRIMVQKAGSEVWEGMDIANIGTASFENIEEYGEGNAYTSFLVTTGEEGEKLYLIKDKTFVEKSYLEENYFTTDEASELFVTLDNKVQIIQGVKFFSEGLYIGLSKIWQSQDDVVYIDANLVVRGGVTMYAQNNVDIPSFMESLLLDENTLKLDENGHLTVIGGAGGSIEHALTWSGFSTGSYDGKSAQNIYIPSKVSELTNDSLFATQSWVKNQGYALASALGNYLPITGGTLTGDLYMGGTTLYVNTIRGNGSSTKYAIFGGGSTGNIAFGGYYAGCTTSLNGETVAIRAADVNKIRVSSSGITVYQDGWLNGLMLNRTVSGGGCSIAVSSNGTHLGQFGINGSSQFELGFASTGTRFTIDSTGECLVKSASAYGITIDRTVSNGGAYTRYRPNNQTRYSWAVGVSNGYAFSVYYQDGTSGIDTQKMSLDSGGNLLTTGGITMYSDERKKTILRHVELSLKEVANAPLIEHYYNSDDKKTTHVGSIAQYWAGLNDWFCKKDNDGYYTMEIQNAALASAISVARELSRFESDTDRRIRLLEEENKELRKEIEQLKTV